MTVGRLVMAGLFPGIDPFLKFQAHWPDFHNRLITEICNELGSRLPAAYVARVDERVEVVIPETESPAVYRPDVLVGRFADSPAGGQPPHASATLVAEPIVAEILDQHPEEIRLTYVEIRALPGLDLVTVIEVLSPVNKSWQGRRAYLEKRDRLHASRINLVEIDLLLSGAPLPMKQSIPPGAYYAIVARGPRLPLAEIYRWTVRDPVPGVPIPLANGDPDVVINLGGLTSRVYDLGRYARTIRCDQPLPESAPLSPEDRTWIESVAKQPGQDEEPNRTSK
jgi:Protein of unknown function (DUF4058)